VRLARLAGNQIGDAGATSLAAALPQMPSLTTLHLSSTAPAGNQIGDAGAAALAAALPQMPSFGVRARCTNVGGGLVGSERQ
jgi:hypothetical protein